jgi:hypothetical protein
MNKLLLVAGLCIGAFVIAPVTSASAAPLTGSCAITGSATFTNKNLTSTPQTEIEYTFSGTATCIEAGTNNPQSGAATVHGKFGGECAKAESEGSGEGSLLGHTFNTFKFKAAAGSVLFEIGGGLPGGITGDAGFYLSGSPLSPGEVAAQCAASPSGVHELGFAAVAVGTLQ